MLDGYQNRNGKRFGISNSGGNTIIIAAIDIPPMYKIVKLVASFLADE